MTTVITITGLIAIIPTVQRAYSDRCYTFLFACLCLSLSFARSCLILSACMHVSFHSLVYGFCAIPIFLQPFGKRYNNAHTVFHSTESVASAIYSINFDLSKLASFHTNWMTGHASHTDYMKRRLSALIPIPFHLCPYFDVRRESANSNMFP